MQYITEDTVYDKDEGSPYHLDPHSRTSKVVNTHASARMIAGIHLIQILSKPFMTLRVVWALYDPRSSPWQMMDENLVDKYPSSLTLGENPLGLHYTISQGSSARDMKIPIVVISSVADSFLAAFPSVSLLYSCTSVSWDHHSNKYCAFGFSPGLIFRECKSKQTPTRKKKGKHRKIGKTLVTSLNPYGQ